MGSPVCKLLFCHFVRAEFKHQPVYLGLLGGEFAFEFFALGKKFADYICGIIPCFCPNSIRPRRFALSGMNWIAVCCILA